MTPSERRLHPLSFVFVMATTARPIVLPGLFVLLMARQVTWQVWGMWLAVPIAIAAIVRHLVTRYAFTDEELLLRTGLLFRNVRHIRYTRIHNVETVRNPLHRMLGVAEVRVQTAGGAEPEAKLQVLSLAAVEEMRRRVFEGKRAAGLAPAAPGSAEVAGEDGADAARAGAAPARALVRLGLADLALFGLLQNRGLIVVAALAGVLWESDVLESRFAGRGRLFRSAWNAIEGRARAFGEWGPSDALLLLGLVLVAVAAVRLLSIGWAIVRLHGFTLTREGDELRTVCGLLTQVRSAIPLHRVQSLSIAASPLQRWAGRVEVRVQTAGGDEAASATREWIAPILRRDDLPALIAEVLPGADPGALDWQPVDARARWRLLRQWLIVVAIPVVAAAVLVQAWALAVAAPLLALAILGARGQARAYGWAVGGDLVGFREGWLWRRTILARTSKVQVVRLTHSPFDRRWRMAAVAADTAGGGAHRIAVPFLPESSARDLARTLTERAASTAFRW